jgi:hypothetical protein
LKKSNKELENLEEDVAHLREETLPSEIGCLAWVPAEHAP